MNTRFGVTILSLLFFLPSISRGQTIERISFDKTDSADGYYMAIVPQSKKVNGVIVLLTSFFAPAALLTETKLHGVTYTNNLLFVVASMKQKLYADDFSVNRINALLTHINSAYAGDSAKFALVGYDEAGNIALRYTELTYQNPAQYPVQPKAVAGIDSPVDIFGLWHWSEQQIKKNYWPGSVGDAEFYLETMTKENGNLTGNGDRYKKLTPFYKDGDSLGNEQYLKNVPVRLYYDADIEWQLNNRRNSFYDTKLPDGSELIKRLLILGNVNAEFIASKKPGIRNNGMRHPSTISIVDEVDFVQWIKRSLDIFDPNTWVPPYPLSRPKGWEVERFSLPPDFATGMSYKGVEDIRFAPGWGDSTKENYWSYCYLWWLAGTPAIDPVNVQKNLQLYYKGLVDRNVAARNIPTSKLVPTQVTVKKIKTSIGDIQTFSGNVRMLDYMTQRPMVLHAMIHLKDCVVPNRVAVFIEISPMSFDHDVWEQMGRIIRSFSCDR